MRVLAWRGQSWLGRLGRWGRGLVVWGLLLLAVRVCGFTVATYNVENYTLADRMADGVYRTAYPKPEKEKSALRRVIVGLHADLLALEEMGPQPFLDELQRDLRRDGADYPYAALLEAADPDRHVAVLSKVPLTDIRRHTNLTIRLLGRTEPVKRGVLEVTVRLPGGELTVMVIHLKSRRTERPDDPEGANQRRAEAAAVRDLILRRFPPDSHARFLVCGDWNDVRGSRPVRALVRRGAYEIGTLLPAEDSRGEVWTHYFHRDRAYSCIDYFLVSPALLPAIEGAQALIYDGPGTRQASDHRPVWVRINL